MSKEIRQLTPYFRDGLLYFPEATVNALLSAGLDARTGAAARRGISLDDQASIGAINAALDVLLTKIEPGTALHAALSSSETRFMLTGKPVGV